MNNFFVTYCNAVNCTSCAGVSSCTTNTPPLRVVFYIGFRFFFVKIDTENKKYSPSESSFLLCNSALVLFTRGKRLLKE